METTIVLDKPVNYDLTITLVAETWYNHLFSGIYEKHIRAEQLDEIRNDPLQDYIGFGFRRVLYVDIEVYPEYVSGDFRIRSVSPDHELRISAWQTGIIYNKEKIMETVDNLNENLDNGTLSIEKIH